MTEIEDLKQQVLLNETIFNNLKVAQNNGLCICCIQGRFVPVRKMFEVVREHLQVLRDRLEKAGV